MHHEPTDYSKPHNKSDDELRARAKRLRRELKEVEHEITKRRMIAKRVGKRVEGLAKEEERT